MANNERSRLLSPATQEKNGSRYGGEDYRRDDRYEEVDRGRSVSPPPRDRDHKRERSRRDTTTSEEEYEIQLSKRDRDHKRERSTTSEEDYEIRLSKRDRRRDPYNDNDEHLEKTRREEEAERRLQKEKKKQDQEADKNPKDIDIEAQMSGSKGETKARDGLRTISLFLVGVVAFGILLIYLDFILIPLIFARLLVYAFQPFINIFIGKKKWPLIKKKTHMPRWLGVILVFLFLLGIFCILGAIIYFSIKTVVDKSDLYLEELEVWRERIIQWGEGLGFTRSQVTSWFPDINWVDYFVQFVSWVSYAAPEAFLIILFVSYMLFEYDEKKDKSKLRRSIDEKIRSYILAQGLIALMGGVIHGTTLLVLGIDLALFFGLMNFVFSWIPNIGAIIAVALPIPIILLTPGTHWLVMAIAIGLPIAFQFVSGQFIEPRILSKAVSLPALTVIVSLMFWGTIWGIIGATLSIPLTVAAKLYLEDTDHPVAKFLSKMLNNIGGT